VGIGEVRRAVFLDRDGVINHVIVRDGKPTSPQSRNEFILIDGATEAIQAFKDAGLTVIIVTNQPDIARKILSPGDLSWMTEKILSETQADEVVVCPHDDDDLCYCRKPKAGMLVESAKKWNIDLTRSFVIGDNWKDVEAGKGAGCTCLLIDAEYNKDVACHIRVKSLSEATEIVLNYDALRKGV
jgi:D-glycero-D-manno-heptose 1,7-bisphosphate phosphatase